MGKRLLVIIVTFNEEGKMGEVMKKIHVKISCISRTQALVTHNTSTDKTSIIKIRNLRLKIYSILSAVDIIL